MTFKTRKDKIIEEQKARIESLEEKVFESHLRRPTIIEQNRDIITVGCKQFLEDGMSVELAKEIIARNMAKELEKFIEYDMEDGAVRNGRNGRPYPIIAGYLHVALRKG